MYPSLSNVTPWLFAWLDPFCRPDPRQSLDFMFCALGHLLEQSDQRADSLRCDCCKYYVRPDQKVWSCAACDYDTCEQCYGLRSQHSTRSGRVPQQQEEGRDPPPPVKKRSTAEVQTDVPLPAAANEEDQHMDGDEDGELADIDDGGEEAVVDWSDTDDPSTRTRTPPSRFTRLLGRPSSYKCAARLRRGGGHRPWSRRELVRSVKSVPQFGRSRSSSLLLISSKIQL